MTPTAEELRFLVLAYVVLLALLVGAVLALYEAAGQESERRVMPRGQR